MPGKLFDLAELSIPLEAWLQKNPALRVMDKKPRPGAFVSGPMQQDRITIRYFLDFVPEKRVLARLYLGKNCEGPPGHAHGGCLSALMDETLAQVSKLEKEVILSADLSIRFIKKVPLNHDYIIEAKLKERKGRFLFTEGTLSDGKIVFCKATAKLVIVE